MSQTVAIDAQALIQHLAGLERYIENLRGALTISREKLVKAREARESLKRLMEKGERNLIVAVDSAGNAFIKATTMEGEKPIIHLGLNVYAEVPFEEAERLLLEREHIYVREMQGIEKELEEKLEEHKRLQALLLALQKQAQQSPQPK